MVPETLVKDKIPQENLEKEEVVKTETLLDVNAGNLAIIYKDYLVNKLSQDKKSLYNLMLVLVPELEDNKLKFIFQSEQQQLLFEELRPEVLGFINGKFKERLESIVWEIDDSVKLGMDKPYTPSEQLEYMLSKSPHLKEAMVRLDLRIK